jgi:acetolactate synthase-1/2/3 large subunit
LGVAPRVLDAISRSFGDDLVLACDVGQQQMWVAQYCRIPNTRAYLTSGGLGTMACGLPAAVGAALADPGKHVLCVTGDGSIMMNIQELATIRRYRLPVKILLLDNSCLGMVRQWQELFFEERYSEVDLSDNPDFVDLAEALGIPAFRLERAEDEEAAIKRLHEAEGPILCHCLIDPRENVWPLVPPGHAIETQIQRPKN